MLRLNNAGIQAFSDTFCPNVLSSSTTSASPSPTGPSLAESQQSIPTASSTSSAPSAVNTVVAKFGEGTPETSWGRIPTQRHGNRGLALEAVSIMLLCVAAVVLAMRFFARVYTKHARKTIKGIWVDDWFALAGQIFAVGICADIVVGSQYGMGKHLPPDTTTAQLTSILKIVYAFVAILTACLGALKMSILFLYLRMTPRRSHRIMIYVVMAFVVAHNIPAQFVSISLQMNLATD